jgi:predicted nucleic acid-binding protein
MKDRIFFDTNVLVYAHDRSDPLKQSAAQELLLAGLSSGCAYLSAQVLGELFVVLTRKISNPMTAGEAIEIVQALGKLEVVEIGVLAVNLALHYVVQGRIGYWDALIVAAARLSGCSTLYTEDLTEGQAFDTVTIVNPFAVAR